ncbi:hypothetical protein NDA01_03670 [Trichocoleus desertorum AS-A10]|uniref:KGK domain-containing protein n=1 Tax=Trichocoleus desertorum TaxID=1481672 RepID=UPI003298D162
MSEFEPLELDDVVMVDKPGIPNHSPFLLKQFLSGLQSLLLQQGSAGGLTNSDGVRCRVLRPGGDWRAGKIRIRLEFCPDAPPSSGGSLDEFRQ